MLNASVSVVAAGDPDSFWAKAYPIIPHPAELIIGLIAFFILYAVMAKVVVPQFEEMYAKRAAAIEGGMEKAEKAQAEAEAVKAELQAKLAEARDEATSIRENARNEASAIAADIRKKAHDEADRITTGAQRQIEAERSQAMVTLRRDVGGLATTLAGKIVGESLQDDGRQKRVIDRFLSELESADADQMRATATSATAQNEGV